MQKNKKILIADDHLVILRAFEFVLSDNYDLSFASNGLELYQRYLEESPDVLIVDIEMPLVDGLDAIRRIREEDKNAKIIIITGKREKKLFQQAMQLKISGYHLKSSFDPADIIENIEGVLKGETYFDDELLELITQNETNPYTLTDTELRVLCYASKGYTAKQTAEKFYRSVETIKVHKTSILSKTESSNMTEAVTKVGERVTLEDYK